MSARERLIRSVYELKNLSQNDMEERVDAFAHELAEQIRAAYAADKGEMYCGDMLTAADLIDPEVER